jgi:predicted nucleic acid-binding Zn ribbon protein
MQSPNRRGPRLLSDILGELFAARGYSRIRAVGELEAAWNEAVGEPACRQTRLGGVRRGVLNITVANPALLEELAAFRKPALLASLRRDAPGTVIHDIRFRVGGVDEPEKPRLKAKADPAAEARPDPAPPMSTGMIAATGPQAQPRPKPARKPPGRPTPGEPAL